MRRITGVFILALLAGGMLIHLLYARRLEQLYRDKESLKVQLFETTERLSRIEEMWADEQREKINTVDFVMNGEMGPSVELELQRQVREITASLPGTMIGEAQPGVLVSLLHRRKFAVENRDYLVTVNWVVIAPGTMFNLDISLAPKGE